MEIEKLRRADIFSGIAIGVFGLWVVSQALKMPMKDSWGGVQNVWFVSPALFPLFVGAIIALLGVGLTVNALKAVGRPGLSDTLAWLKSPALIRFLKSDAMMRFHAVVVLLFSFVFLTIPRIDFFLCAVLFLTAFISMFYLDDAVLLLKMLRAYLAGTVILLLWFVLGIPGLLEGRLPYPSDWLSMAFIAAYGIYVFTLVRSDTAMRKKYRTSLTIAVAAPFVIGPIFKYFLLVPMPTEGLIVALLDAIRYWDF